MHRRMRVCSGIASEGGGQTAIGEEGPWANGVEGECYG